MSYLPARSHVVVVVVADVVVAVAAIGRLKPSKSDGYYNSVFFFFAS